MAKKYFILALLLLMALGSYQYAFSQGIVIFIVLGLIFDMTFWFSITGKRELFVSIKLLENVKRFYRLITATLV